MAREMNLRQTRRSLTRVDERAHRRERHPAGKVPAKSPKVRSVTEGEGFEPSVDRKAHNGFRDRAETAAMPHHNWSLRPGGIQGGMNFGAAFVLPIGSGARHPHVARSSSARSSAGELASWRVLDQGVEESFLPPARMTPAAQPVVGDAPDPIGRIAAGVVAEKVIEKQVAAAGQDRHLLPQGSSVQRWCY
jgi:hypothetical protein